MYLISFILTFLSFTFYIKYDETDKFFLCKNLTMLNLKRQDFIQKIFEKFAFYGLDMEPEPEP
jgi:hypothetical protein